MSDSIPSSLEFMIVISGDEILSGRRFDKHIPFITQTFSPYGMACQKAVIVGDTFKPMVKALREAIATVPVTIVTGGLGPTVDDVTRDAISEATNIPLKEDAEAFKTVSAIFEKFGRKMTENNRRQALVPIRGSFFPNPNGTAPGLLFDCDGPVVIALPGPPRELEPMLLDQVLPYLQSKFSLANHVSSKYLHFCCLGESAIDQVVRDRVPADPDLRVSSLAGPGMVDLTFYMNGDPTECQKKLRHYADLVRAEIGDAVYSEDEKMTLEGAVATLLTQKNSTVAVAESCTGGLLASNLTSIPGASAYFLGGVVSYSNEAKQKHLGVQAETLAQYGAVSRETVEEMARGVCRAFGSEWGLAITGIAGPEGGTPEKPVGTVWIAASHRGEAAYPFKVSLPGERAVVQLRSAIYALDQLRRLLMGLPLHQ
ncbi:MAG: competence/damage-inducible protein A [bacterium]|jgi:nicotinamide-nucleotide amidase|nr:competence/damage-inducible protein A [bacterium]